MADMSSYVVPMQRILGELKPKKILEIGIGYDAFSTQVWLSDGSTNVTTVDKRDWGGFGERYSRDLPKRYRFIEGRSEIVLPELDEKFDFIYVDGDHAYEGCKADILNCMPLLKKDGVILMDDYGVEREDTAVDIDDNGGVIAGAFGVKKACDECFTDEWEEVFTHIPFGNGGKAYRRKNEVKPRKR